MSENGEGPEPNEAGTRDTLLFISTGLAASWNRILARAKELMRERDGSLSESEGAK
jgi:hypothetical protein